MYANDNVKPEYQLIMPLKDPAALVLDMGEIAVLPDGAALISRDGRQILIDDSTAPIRDVDGATEGSVVVFYTSLTSE